MDESISPVGSLESLNKSTGFDQWTDIESDEDVNVSFDAGFRVERIGSTKIDLTADALKAAAFAKVSCSPPKDPSLIALTADYGGDFCAAIWRKNLFATQFHPEKSQANGLKILDNFAKWDGSSSV